MEVCWAPYLARLDACMSKRCKNYSIMIVKWQLKNELQSARQKKCVSNQIIKWLKSHQKIHQQRSRQAEWNWAGAVSRSLYERQLFADFTHMYICSVANHLDRTIAVGYAVFITLKCVFIAFIKCINTYVSTRWLFMFFSFVRITEKSFSALSFICSRWYGIWSSNFHSIAKSSHYSIVAFFPLTKLPQNDVSMSTSDLWFNFTTNID